MSSHADLREPARVRTATLRSFKQHKRPITMLTCYDALSARIFDTAGIDVLLVGDSLANVVLGYETTLSATHEQMQLFAAAVARSVTRPLVIADFAFGSYEVGPAQALKHGVDLMRAGAHAVKLEGAQELTPTVAALVAAGIPVCGHLGFTPQSVHQLGGHRVQGRDSNAAERLVADARALQDAGVFALVLEMVPAELAARITHELEIPTIGIGAGVDCDGQVLVWQDMAGLSDFSGTFVKRFGALGEELSRAAGAYRDQVRARTFPSAEHSFS